MPTLRLSVQHLAPTATRVTSAIQYFAPSQKYVHGKEIAPSLSLDSAHSYFTSSRWNVSLQQPVLSFVCRLTSCWSLSSAAHLCTVECRWGFMLPGSSLKQQVLHAHSSQILEMSTNRGFLILYLSLCNPPVLLQWQCGARGYFGGQQCSAAEFCSVWTRLIC